MSKLFKIAARNLRRYRRRTFLTASLIVVGVVFVLIFVAVTGSFKAMMIGQITDSYLGHIQVHKKGYVASIDTLPLTMNLSLGAVKIIEQAIGKIPEIEAYSPRIKLGGLFSNFVETTNIRLNGIYPEKETQTLPLFPSRIKAGDTIAKKGEILVPELLARGMKVKVGDTVVVIATNKDGSVNGKQFKVVGVIESASGPGGRDGYIHIQDAMELLRMDNMEISEIVIRIKDFNRLDAVYRQLNGMLSKERNKKDKPIFEVHNWEELSPFSRIAKMIDVMTLFIKLMLTAIVLISIMNVMIMAVYERVREIGTIAAIGTLPGKIRSMFVIEGFCLGLIGAVSGCILSEVAILLINVSKITFDFGRNKGLLLTATINSADFLMICAIVIVVSVLASLQPAFKASRMDPIQALRHV